MYYSRFVGCKYIVHVMRVGVLLVGWVVRWESRDVEEHLCVMYM